MLKKFDRYTDLEKLKPRALDSVIRTEFDCDWSNNLASYPKADTFKEFKNHMRMENYLNIIKSRKQRVSFSKFRLSDHCLMIEKARHQRFVPDRQHRVCPFCPTEVEDEIHFLIKCTKYDTRDDLFNDIENKVPNFPALNDKQKFTYRCMYPKWKCTPNGQNHLISNNLLTDALD